MEVAALQERLWGRGWEKQPIEKVWSFERVDWYPGHRCRGRHNYVRAKCVLAKL